MGALQDTTTAAPSFRATTRDQIERNLAMSPEADDFLAELAHRTGLKEGEVIRLALILFKTAIDAKEQGKHVGIAEAPEMLDIELVGF